MRSLHGRLLVAATLAGVPGVIEIVRCGLGHGARVVED